MQEQLEKAARFLQYAGQVVDEYCKNVKFTVDKETEPFVYNALVRLFGDEFTGEMTYSMYEQLLRLRVMMLGKMP